MNEHSKKLETLINESLKTTNDLAAFSQTDAAWLIPIARESIIRDPTLIKINSPVNICGDLHGMYIDLLKALKFGGMPPETTWLFLGDYVDRGPQSVEIVLLLFALKARYPDNVFLLRGNHETDDLNCVYGFKEECEKKFINKKMWDDICEVFTWFPLAAVVQDAFFCVHGGISPDLGKVSQIARIKRPVTIPKTGLICDLLWSDPDINVSFFEESDRGNTLCWGVTAARQFLDRNKFKMIIRGHQVAKDGYYFPFSPDENVVTVFTASSNSPTNIVKACFMSIKSDSTYNFVMLPSEDTPPIPFKSNIELKKNDRGKPPKKKEIPLALKRGNGLTSSQSTFKKIPKYPARTNSSPLTLAETRTSNSRYSSTSALKIVKRPLF